MTPITEDEINAARSPKGGFKAATFRQWGISWPPPKGWKETILAHGIPYQHELNEHAADAEVEITEDRLQRMMDASRPQMIDGEPFECVGELDIDPASLLRKVVGAVISYDQGHILWEFPEVLAFFGSRIPQREEVAGQTHVNEAMFEAADKWPNRRRTPATGEAA
jgi:hypothetical protein